MRNQLPAILVFGACLALGFFGSPALAQPATTYPAQGVLQISPFPVGSSPDVVARTVGERLAVTSGECSGGRGQQYPVLHVPCKQA
jgi:tripartite-type tricarboxylate transporter receptor subunit TctC